MMINMKKTPLKKLLDEIDKTPLFKVGRVENESQQSEDQMVTKKLSFCSIDLPEKRPKRPAPSPAFSPSAHLFNQKISNKMQMLHKRRSSSTLVVCQPDVSSTHAPNQLYQENHRRMSVLCDSKDGILKQEKFASHPHLQWANPNQIQPAQLVDMLRVHNYAYLQHLQRTCQLQNQLDQDTQLSTASYQVARLASGSVCHAIDQVVGNKNRNSFVVIRPPGHHAGSNGAVASRDHFAERPDMCSNGFCLLNHVAIGAGYAMTKYAKNHYSTSRSPKAAIEKVAIIDFDIHHGNGTQEIVENLSPGHKQQYPLPASWAPQYFDNYKPWISENDSENVFFSSVHLFDNADFYPCSGLSSSNETNSNIVNITLDIIGSPFVDQRHKAGLKARKSYLKEASETFRRKIKLEMLPKLLEFNPDLILVSAGFDGHADDFYYYLTEYDYSWLTTQLQSVADQCSDGKLISVLEGGYNLDNVFLNAPKKNKNSSAGFSNTQLAAAIHQEKFSEENEKYGSLARSCSAHLEALLK